jgi:hypothetical protein
MRGTARGKGGMVAAILLAHAVLLAWSDKRNSPSIDEVGHLAAGLSHWDLGHFELYRVNPPLVRLVAALPVWLIGVETRWDKPSDLPGLRPEFETGRDLISANGSRSFLLFAVARWACLPFSLLAGWFCFLWGRELYGDWAGILALAAWSFSPMVLANAAMITPDTGAAALGLAAAYYFWKWLREGGWKWTFVAGLMLGLAELTKTTWIILFVLWPLLWLTWRWLDRAGRSWFAEHGIEMAQLAGMATLALLILNLGYGFEGTLVKLGEYPFISETLSGTANGQTIEGPNRFSNTWMGKLPVPLPRNYLLGIDHQKHDFEMTMRSYLRGEWRQGGWWYYYLYALLVKIPIGTWILGLLAWYVGIFQKGYSAPWRDELVLIAPIICILTLVSSQTGFNHHSRYVLPLFPFAFVWMSKVAQAVDRRAHVITGLASIAVVWTIASSLSVYPHSMSYFNEWAGGPEKGHAHLVDSNIDWGQDLLYLKNWLDEHPQARPISLAYFGCFDPRVAGIEFRLPPQKTLAGDANGPDMLYRRDKLEPGWYAVSVTLLRGGTFPLQDGAGHLKEGHRDAFTYFLDCRPAARAGYSIYIYHLDREEAEFLNRQYDFERTN